jgi:hypothetical protein
VARWLADYHRLKSVHDQRGFDALIAIGYSILKPRPRHPEAASEEDRAALKKKATTAAEEQCLNPDATVEIWVMDEHSQPYVRLNVSFHRARRAPDTSGVSPIAASGDTTRG